VLCVSVLSSYVDSTREILYAYTFYVYMHTYRSGNLSVYMHTYRRIAKKRIELVVTLYVYMRICAKKSHFTYFWVKIETHPKFM
jgi:hypothetical protein